MSKEVMTLARAALARMKGYGDTFGYRSNEQNPYEEVCEAIAAIDALAEQPAQQQEPVAAKIAAQLRAMAVNYPAGHLWDKLDAKACIEGALLLEGRHPKAPQPAQPQLVPEKYLQVALEALAPLEKLFTQADKQGLLTGANVDCQISVIDLRQSAYAASDIRDHLNTYPQPAQQEPVARVLSQQEMAEAAKRYTSPPAQQEPERVKFERHWKKTRGEKKANRELPRHPLQPQTYIQDSANRHWVTWQAAVRSVAPPAQRKPLTDDARGHLVIEHLGPNALLHKPMSIYDAFHMGIDAAEAAHSIKS